LLERNRAIEDARTDKPRGDEGGRESARRNGRPRQGAAIEQGPPKRDRQEGGKCAMVAGQAQQGREAPMTDAERMCASRMGLAHLLLTRGNPDERAWAIDEAERLLRDLPPSCFPFLRDDALDVVEAARGGDVGARSQLADSLDLLASLIERTEARAKATKPRSPRKPSVRKLIKQAEESGKQITSVTTPDGVTLKFGKPEGAVESAGNEWDEVLLRHGTH
jgi:hypothetical protein